MDPLSQGAFGASFSQSLSNKKQVGVVFVLGLLSGMAPDLDVFFRSDTDPLLFLEFHRQFTHSLIFIPFGGLACATIFYLLFAKRFALTFKQTYLFCTLGYATHGLLDSCTSYGTQLFWPFTNYRVSWDIVSIIDPLFTIPLIICILFAAILKKPKIALVGFIWALAYLTIGFIQNQRAIEVGKELAQSRNHQIIRIHAKPSLGNLILWRSLYETKEGFYTDAIRATNQIKIYTGSFTPRLDIKRDFPWLDEHSQQAKDLNRFAWFSQEFVAVDTENPYRVFDVRYSMLPNKAKGLWSVWLDPNADKNTHIKYKMDRENTKQKRKIFWEMLKGN